MRAAVYARIEHCISRGAESLLDFIKLLLYPSLPNSHTMLSSRRISPKTESSLSFVAETLSRDGKRAALTSLHQVANSDPTFDLVPPNSAEPK